MENESESKDKQIERKYDVNPRRFDCPCGNKKVITFFYPHNPPCSSNPHLEHTCIECGRRGKTVLSLTDGKITLGGTVWICCNMGSMSRIKEGGEL